MTTVSNFLPGIGWRSVEVHVPEAPDAHDLRLKRQARLSHVEAMIAKAAEREQRARLVRAAMGWR